MKEVMLHITTVDTFWRINQTFWKIFCWPRAHLSSSGQPIFPIQLAKPPPSIRLSHTTLLTNIWCNVFLDSRKPILSGWKGPYIHHVWKWTTLTHRSGQHERLHFHSSSGGGAYIGISKNENPCWKLVTDKAAAKKWSTLSNTLNRSKLIKVAWSSISLGSCISNSSNFG